MPIRTYFSLLCLLLFNGMVIAQQNNEVTLSSALQLATRDNPNLAQLRARSEAMASIAPQVAALPDPVISFSALNLPTDTFNLGQENMTQLQGGISQAIPFPGKLALREQTAQHEAEAAAHNVVEARWQLMREVKQQWWNLFYLDRALAIISANQNLLRQFIKIASTKYEVGEGLQQDVLLAQLELSKMLENELSLSGARRNTAARLNALLNLPANHPLRLPKQTEENLPSLQTEDALYTTAEQRRALLSAQQQRIKAAESRLQLAERDYYPDFNIGAYYGGREDMPNGQERADFLSFRLSMNVPLFAADKQGRAVDQRSSELMQQKYALRDEWNRTRAQISQAYNDFQRAKQQAQLFKTGIIPQARQTVSSMLAGYQVNKVDFLNLVRSQVTLFNYETQYWKTLAEAHQALAQLTASVGKEEIYE
ncbi:TolC family protein [Methylomarinum vadi]|uniref:TolC family protein n=1 Tax=Methylomarinum vadi TaxID=438855 RepID=UPI0004DFA210|nr:TolC family protein [Methylomarinum vadi]